MPKGRRAQESFQKKKSKLSHEMSVRTQWEWESRGAPDPAPDSTGWNPRPQKDLCVTEGRGNLGRAGELGALQAALQYPVSH